MANNESDNKKWNRPWSMDEMIDHAENWSLAGDVALLNSIKAYADNLLSKTLSISDNVDELLNGLNEVGLKLEISQNEFQSLRNTQFIESRVYEDDETLDVKEEIKKDDKTVDDKSKNEMIREATLEGLRVVDKYFDKIEVSISDSEEESERSYVLQSKDLYVDRPLPLVIGTEDWYKKWHAGLAESSSEDESDKASETYSESDSEDNLPKDLLKGSETSSELDFSSQTNDRPVANSTFNDSTRQPDIFESDESDEHGSLPVKAPVSSKNFAEQLAEKLGNVISEREVVPTEVNTRPIQPAPSSQFTGNLFSDEPPPLDDLDDTILPKSAQTGLFSGGQGLFDDNEDDLFWGQQSKVEPEKKVEVKQDLPPDVNKSVHLPQVSKGLFDSDESSDDELFASSKKQISKAPFLQPFKTTAPLFDEEPPEIDTQKKNPAKTNLFENETTVKSEKAGLFDKKVETSVAKTVPKKVNLFDDDDYLFKDDLFADITTEKPSSNLFDTVESDNEPPIDIFNDPVVKPAPVDKKQSDKFKKKVVSLFSDAEDEDEDYLSVSKTETVEDHHKLDDTKEVNKTLEKEPEVFTSGNLSERQVIGAEKKITKGLFDDDDTEELFKGSITPPSESTQNPPPKSNTINLFGSSPPPDDDNWDAKSDNFSDTDDQFSYRIDSNAGASSLFDNEPPSLGPNESSGIVRDQNITRVDADDSSFYPYASSSRRLSSDIFTDQQSQDSLFVTKSKTESISIIPPPLDIIPEHNSSYVDITPSGHLSDLDDSKVVDPIFGGEEPKKQKKVVSLFDDDDVPEDLFSSKIEGNPLPKLSEKRNNPGENPKEEIDTKRSPEKSKIADIIEQIQSEPVKEQPSSSNNSPRKLKHNLKINVNALLPGFGPPKMKDLPKSQSLELPKDDTPTSDVSTPDTAYFTPQASNRGEKGASSGSDKAVSFEDALDNVEVLHSITRDRVKIPVKRRPSTRRGRREAISKSVVDLSVEGSEEIVPEQGKAEEAGVLENEGRGAVAEVESSKKDLWVPQTEIVPPVEAETSKPPANDIFEDNDEDLFPNLKKSNAKSKTTLFDSGDSDTDLFGPTESKKAKKHTKEVKNKSLFNDSSSDEDLFSTSSKKKVSEQSKIVGKRTQKSSTLRKLENIQTDDDPLSSLLK